LCLALRLEPSPVRSDGRLDAKQPVAVLGVQADRTAELDATAKAFLKAHHNKDVDAMMAAADAPFLVGTVRTAKILKEGADLRGELQSRLRAGEKLAGKVAKTLTWAKALSPAASAERAREMRELKPAIDVTGENGGYAALADAKGKLLAVSSTRLLVGIRDGKAKVVGILDDPKGR
jgi:hypothetical protein